MEEQQIIKALQVDMVKSINPAPTDVIVWEYDMENMSCEFAYKVFRVVREAFPNNKTIGIPNKDSIKVCNKMELEEIVSNIQELLI